MDKIPFFLKAIIVAINLIGFGYLTLSNLLTISKQTSTKLIITFRPILSLSIGIIISQIVILYLFFAVNIVPIHKITCEHSIQDISTANFDFNLKHKYLPTNCKISEINLFNNENNLKLIPNLLQAKIEQIETDEQDKSKYSYRMILLNQSETIPFTDYTYINSKIDELRLFASSINDFLFDSREIKLVRIIDERYLVYAGIGLSIFFALIFLLLILTGLFIDFCFDKETAYLTVTRYRCLGIFGKQEFKYSFNEIIDVKNERIETSESYHNRVCVKVPNEKLFLTPTISFSRSVSIGFFRQHIENKDYIVKVIKDFLGMK
ncbi:hypothetical protein [Rivularia sp. UHCC 0363]|uniref:hypothetical protein n=1 Tax=Rivularia sp. UHCC 0363 TaxID=3110244 RepID=UPI002B1F0B81|nr:hypothetical protein [Rivularia sp. UHCC 0363]MEA5598381.1 hypothetical protein [Rivularia sp. UHCC 0363]